MPTVLPVNNIATPSPSRTRADWEPAIVVVPFIALPANTPAVVFGLPPPIATAVLASGGTIPVGATGYRISSVDPKGRVSLPGPEVTITTTTGNQTVTLTWNRTGASSYQVFGRTAGGELYMATVADPGSGTTVTYSDTGAVVPSGALPTTSGSGSYPTFESVEGIVYEIVATNNTASNSVLKIYNGNAQIGSLALPANSTQSFPVSGAVSGMLMTDLWMECSGVIDLTVLLNG